MCCVQPVRCRRPKRYLSKRNNRPTADSALAAYNLFQLRVRRGDYEQALTDLQAAINNDPLRYTRHDINKYPIERILGAGGMGVVFLCQHKLRKQRVVVKCFWESRQGPAEQVFKEAFAMAEIAKDYVPMPLDYGYADPIQQQRAFFVTEYLDGAIDGETWLKQYGKLNLADGLQVAWQIANGLQAALAAGILHLDLKPANILLKRGSNHAITVKIIDFCLAQVATPLQQQAASQQASRTQYSLLVGQAVFGTFDYGCPEQQGLEQYGKPGVQCEVFGFGQTMKRLFSGKQPRHCRERDLPNMSALRDLLFECTEVMPTNRPASARAVINVLEPLIKTGDQAELLETDEQLEAVKAEEKTMKSINTGDDNKAEPVNADDYLTWFEKGNELYRLGQFEQAIES